MKHVLYVNGWPAIGGSERAQLTLFRELKRRYRISAVLADEAREPLRRAVEALDIPYTLAPLIQLRQTLDPRTLAHFARRWAVSSHKIHELIRRQAVDLVHVTHLYDVPFSAPACKLAGVPLFWLIEDPERYDAVNRFVVNTCRLDAYAATSTPIFERASRGGLKAPLRTMIPNSYDERVFSPDAGTEQRARRGEPVRIGFAGIFVDRKGVLELCRGFVALARRAPALACELWLAGHGPDDYRSEMNDVLRKGGVFERVRFVEGLSGSEQMVGFYRDVDLFVMLSKGEGMSIAMLESQACGIPAAILSPWGDDVIEHDTTGVILPNDDPETVATGLLPLVRDTERRLAMGRRAAAHLKQHFSSAAVAERMAELYERIWAQRA